MVILGNLLENAVEASEKDATNAEIMVNSKLTKESLYIHIRNTCTVSPRMNENDLPLSTKENDRSHGLGLQSVQDIVNQYDGIMEIKHGHNSFSVYVMLPFPK